MKKICITDVQASTIVRLVVLVAALLNLGLSLFTDFRIPELSETSQQAIAVLITAAVSIISYWYNNSWSKNATTVDKLMTTIRESGVSVDDVMESIEILQESMKGDSVHNDRNDDEGCI